MCHYGPKDSRTTLSVRYRQRTFSRHTAQSREPTIGHRKMAGILTYPICPEASRQPQKLTVT